MGIEIKVLASQIVPTAFLPVLKCSKSQSAVKRLLIKESENDANTLAVSLRSMLVCSSGTTQPNRLQRPQHANLG